LRQVIRNLQQEKKTILLTTHYMFEADALCDRIAVINHGKIIALDTPLALKELVSDLSIIELEVFGVPEKQLQQVQELAFVDMVTVEDRDQRQMLLVQTPRGSEAIPELMHILQDIRVGKVIVREPTLEDAYVRLVSE
jgi:ABC-2 type transport system ATP-binding protein